MAYNQDQINALQNLITADPMPPVPPTQRLTPRTDALEAEQVVQDTKIAALQAAVTSLHVALTTLQSKSQNKRVSIGTMALGEQRSVLVTWPVPFADTNYTAIPVLWAGTTLLSTVEMRGVVAKNATGCTVLVRATGILATGVTLDVTAIHD